MGLPVCWVSVRVYLCELMNIAQTRSCIYNTQKKTQPTRTFVCIYL